MQSNAAAFSPVAKYLFVDFYRNYNLFFKKVSYMVAFLWKVKGKCVKLHSLSQEGTLFFIFLRLKSIVLLSFLCIKKKKRSLHVVVDSPVV
jgi:hypothetical protein